MGYLPPHGRTTTTLSKFPVCRRLGAVQIGHHTGGLGKMPGFYYRAPLDCREDQAIRWVA